MAQQIEPIEFFWINGQTKIGVNLTVYTLHPLFESNRVKAEITDIDNNLLFSTILIAKTIEDVAQQLGLTLIKTQ